MKKLCAIFLSVFFIYCSQAQVPNDDCHTATDIGVMDGTYNFLSWDFNLFDTCVDISTLDATTSYPYIYTDSSCNAYLTSSVSRDVWFKFVSPGAFTIRGIQSQNAQSPTDSVSITFWEGGSCDSLRAIGNYQYVINPGNPFFYDSVWVNGNNIQDTLYAQVSGINFTDTVQLYLCFRGINSIVPSIAGCYYTNANTDTVCFQYSTNTTEAFWGNTGTATIEIQKGRAPFSFLWSDGNTDSARTNLAAGKYFFTISDNGGCSESDSVTIAPNCSVTLLVEKAGPAYYNFEAICLDTLTLKQFVWSINSDTIIQDSVSGHIFYHFSADSSYQICLHLSDTNSQCNYDTCIQITITNASYVPLLDSINIWHYTSNMIPVITNPENNNSRSTGCGPGIWNPWNGFSEYTGNDTSINGKSYKLLWSQNHGTVPAQECVMGYIREDILKRRVYFWDTDSTHESLLYDFGMNIGDTIYLNFPLNGNIYQTGIYRLDSFAPFATGQTTSARKVFYLKKLFSANLIPLKWVEGIGNLAELVYPYNYFDGWGGGLYSCQEYQNPGSNKVLICYEHKQLDFYDACALSMAKDNLCFNFLDTCSYYLICGGINEVSSIASLEIFPNPAQKEINLKLEVKQADNFSIRVVDLQSRAVSPVYNLGKLGEGMHNSQINLPSLPAGLYFIECITSQGNLFKKLLMD